MKILVVDDEELLVKGIRFNLQNDGYQVVTGSNGREAIELARDPDIRLIVLDVMMPEVDGLTACRTIREFSDVPIIMLTARTEDMDKLLGFEHGADDYLTKPFSVDELLARLRVTQRRLLLLQTSSDADSPVFQNGKLKIDYAAGCAYLNGEELHLTPIEYKLLCLLSHNVGKVLTHTYITQQIWGSSWENDIASLRVFMATLRKKLELQKDSPQYIQTHIGVGYRMLRVD